MYWLLTENDVLNANILVFMIIHTELFSNVSGLGLKHRGLGLKKNFGPRPHSFWPRPYAQLASLSLETAQDRHGQKHEPKMNISSGQHAKSKIHYPGHGDQASSVNIHLWTHTLNRTGLKVDDRRDEIFTYKSFGGVTTSRDAAWRALLTCQWMLQVGCAKQHHVT